MPNFGEMSNSLLGTCHPDLIRLFTEVIKHSDCKVTDGRRGKAAQNSAYKDGRSELEYPNSGHNKRPSLAIDVVPYPVDYNDRERFLEFRKFVYGIAGTMNIKLKKTIDWDLMHFELA